MPIFILTYFAHKSVVPTSMELLHERKGSFTTSYDKSLLDDGYTGIICSFEYLEDLNRFVREAYQKFGVYFYIQSLLCPSYGEIKRIG